MNASRDEGPLRRTAANREGEVEVFVADEQDAHPVETARWAALAAGVLHDEGVVGQAELSLLFVAEDVIADLNQRFMGASGPTDVLAFPIDSDQADVGRWPDGSPSGPDRSMPSEDDLPLLLGDIVICPAVAARNAPTHAGSYDDEVALLVVHGILHVLGMDHAEPEERASMQARERRHLERYHFRTGTP